MSYMNSRYSYETQDISRNNQDKNMYVHVLSAGKESIVM